MRRHRAVSPHRGIHLHLAQLPAEAAAVLGLFAQGSRHPRGQGSLLAVHDLVGEDVRILGIDPGATTGWCEYRSNTRSVVSSCQTEKSTIPTLDWATDVFVIEKVVPHGASYPQVVEAAWIGGEIVGYLRGRGRIPFPITRMEVRQTLQEAVHGTVKVKDDKTVWAALLALHGGDRAAKKGGALHGVRSHERAALAVAVAWALRNCPSTMARLTAAELPAIAPQPASPAPQAP